MRLVKQRDDRYNFREDKHEVKQKMRKYEDDAEDYGDVDKTWYYCKKRRAEKSNKSIQI